MVLFNDYIVLHVMRFYYDLLFSLMRILSLNSEILGGSNNLFYTLRSIL